MSRKRARRAAQAVTVGVAVLAFAGLAVARYAGGGLARGPDLRRLARALGPVRVVAPRLTGGFGFAPCDSVRGDAPVAGFVCQRHGQRVPSTELLAFAADLRAMRLSRGGAGGGHVGGVYALLWPDVQGSVASGVGALRAAVAAGSRNPDVLSDLSAALLVQAEVDDDPRALVEAVAMADSATSLDHDHREAQFNLALGLEHLFLEADAIDAWRRYLALDTDSPWAQEARRHLAALAQPQRTWPDLEGRLVAAAAEGDTVAANAVVRAAPHRSQVLARDALYAWAHAQPGDAARDSLLRLAGVVGLGLEVATGDAQIADGVRVLGRASPAVIAATARGLVALQRAQQYTYYAQSPQAAAPARQAVALLDGAGSPFRWWAWYAVAGWRWLEGGTSLDSALAATERIRRAAPPEYRWVRAMAARNTGLVYHVRAVYGPAGRMFRLAIREGARTGDPELTARVPSWLAQIELDLRGPEAAWHAIYQALTRIPGVPEGSRARHDAFNFASTLARSVAPGVAIRFEGEVVTNAAAMHFPVATAVSLGRRAELLTYVGDDAGARADLAEAREALALVTDRNAHDQIGANLALAAARLELHRNPAAARASLESTIATYRTYEVTLALRQAYLALADANVALGDIGAADSAFNAALATTERERGNISVEAERARFLDVARTVFDRIAAFHAERGEPARAFDFFERARGRVLLERLANDASPEASAALTLREIQRRLPSDVTLVSYGALSDRLLVWTVDAKTVKLQDVRVTSQQLDDMVARLARAVLDRSAAADLDGATAALYRRLIAPVAGAVGDGRRLVFVPDRSLYGVPFALLRPNAAAPFLVERHAIAVAPSATLYVASLARSARHRFDGPIRALIMGNPDFDPDRFRLPALPGAEAEARQVATAYSHPLLFMGPSATAGVFETDAPQADVIHFAGHAVVRTDAPALSHLVLAGDGEAGALYARDILDLRLDHTRLAVLSGCHTSSGRMSDTEGPASLARAFFAAGVPAVVASLWAVEDDRTAEFFADYHRRLAAGVDPVSALRATQLDWIASPGRREAVATWAAFELLGAAAR